MENQPPKFEPLVFNGVFIWTDADTNKKSLDQLIAEDRE
jgi:hypothetical protein